MRFLLFFALLMIIFAGGNCATGQNVQPEPQTSMNSLDFVEIIGSFSFRMIEIYMNKLRS